MKKQDILVSLILVGIIVMPILVSADTTTVDDAVTRTITAITDWVVGISLGLATLMYVIAGFMWMSDAGNMERSKIAKNIIISTTIGLVVILIAKGLIGIVSSLVSRSTT